MFLPMMVSTLGPGPDGDSCYHTAGGVKKILPLIFLCTYLSSLSAYLLNLLDNICSLAKLL